MQIRHAVPADRDSIQKLHLATFPASEREAIANVAVALLAEESTPDILTLVAIADDERVGHVAFSPVTPNSVDSYMAYILAPLAVHPDWQRQGIGTALIEAGMKQLTERSVDIVFVYGDPQYYGRFGFTVEAAGEFEAPYPLQYPQGWQAKRLSDASNVPSSGQLTCVEPLRDSTLW